MNNHITKYMRMAADNFIVDPPQDICHPKRTCFRPNLGM